MAPSDFGRRVIDAGQRSAERHYDRASRARLAEHDTTRAARLDRLNADDLGARAMRAARGVERFTDPDDVLSEDEAANRQFQRATTERLRQRDAELAEQRRAGREAAEAGRQAERAEARRRSPSAKTSSGNW